MSENKNSSARIAANNRYNEKAYDRINLAIPKGDKARIQTCAARHGESVNAYVKSALYSRLAQDEAAASEE